MVTVEYIIEAESEIAAGNLDGEILEATETDDTGHMLDSVEETD